MSHPLWQKSGVQIDTRIMHFLAANDVVLDRAFFLHDIVASKAHVEGLFRIGIITTKEATALKNELDKLAEDFKTGAFVLDERYEDGHSAIEARLSERLGETGRRVHTGRSRNDQVLVAIRLWLKEKMTVLRTHCHTIATVCLRRAAEEALPLPGYTHLQRAVVSSTSMWFAGFAEAFIDNSFRTRSSTELMDANPLGTAAGYGVNLPLERAYTTSALGFARMQISPVYAQLSRGKYEMMALETLGAAMLDLRRLAWDLSLFTTGEFNFVKLPARYTTGSSIMPNKRNPDVVELLRASYATVASARNEIEQLLSLPSGYQRDVQLTKSALLRGIAQGLKALELLPDLLATLEWNEAAMRAAIEPAMYATDIAVEQAKEGLPFRDAYRAAAQSTSCTDQKRTPEESLAARTSPGAGNALQLDELAARLAISQGC